MRTLRLLLSVLFLAACLAPAPGRAQKGRQKYSLAILNLATASHLLTDGDARVLTERLTREMSRAGLFFTMSQDNMEKGLLLDNIDPYGCDNIDCAVKAGKSLGVQLVVFGIVSEKGALYTLDAKMIHVSSGEVVQSRRDEFSGDLTVVYDNLPAFAAHLLGIPDSAPSAPVAKPAAPEPAQDAPELETGSPIAPLPAPEVEYETGGWFKWKYVAFGALVVGGVGAGLLIANGAGSSSPATPVVDILPDPPTFP